MAKRYYWLKLPEDFFRQKAIKKLRRIAGGDTYTVIYLKMLLLALKQEGKLFFEGVEDDFCDELALDLDEEPDNVKITIQFLIAQGLMQECADNEYILPECTNLTGSEDPSAARVRAYRSRKALQCNADVTECNVAVTSCNTEKEIEKETDTEIETDTEKSKEKKKNTEDRGEAKTEGTISDEIVCQTQSVSLDVKEVAEAWNNLQSLGIKPVSKMSASSTRYKALSARIREHGKDKVLEAIENIKASNFLQGMNDKGWVITFDWFVKPNNFVKVLDGNYSNRVTREQEKKGDDRYDGIKSWAIKNGLNTGEGSVVGDNNNSENSVSDKGFFGF
jgi:predicted phage replisome organizer